MNSALHHFTISSGEIKLFIYLKIETLLDIPHISCLFFLLFTCFFCFSQVLQPAVCSINIISYHIIALLQLHGNTVKNVEAILPILSNLWASEPRISLFLTIVWSAI
jgi:hypothetical protein